MGGDFTNLNAGCHGPVPLETGARSEDGANHSRIFRRSITSRAITKARFVCSTAAIRSTTQRTSRPFRGRWVNRRPLGYEPTPGPHCNRLLPIKAAETRPSPSPPLGSDRRLFEGVPAQTACSSLPHTGDHQDWNFCARLTSATHMFSGTSMGGPHLLPDAGELTGLLSVNWSPT